ncbi:hypothetical protein BKM09_005030 [Pseudomonas amygdali pv. morsprunorum]|nr:hypothetical protein BKM19_022520 [Pseudomonas amygdali pv. morsprunorum]POP89486.1 hypothetical protein CXB39_26585 [Pseudomonas amygdali pv. morsprunorum]POY78351.1 hypothetical protein BKM09_005030 [Pseudomonas amygdali pv. morsprunorum]TSC34835.1 hypothetical protein FOM00_22685 [Pseudomonas sp. ST1]
MRNDSHLTTTIVRRSASHAALDALRPVLNRHAEHLGYQAICGFLAMVSKSAGSSGSPACSFST